MDKADFSSLINSEDWPLLYAFNFCPLTYIQPGWLEPLDFGGDFAQLLQRCPEQSNRWLLAELGLDGLWAFNLENAATRLALADAQSLQTIVRYCGLARWSPMLRQIVWRQPRYQLRQSLGDRAYGFAVNTAPLLLGHWPDGVLKEAPVPLESEDFLHTLDVCGLELLLALMDDGAGLLARLKLKFPVALASCFARAPTAALSDPARLLQLLRKVTKVASPQCLHLLN